MPRSKAERIATLDSFPNVIGNYDREQPWTSAAKLAWPAAVTMELGCGRADFLLQLAAGSPHGLFVGADKKAARLWAGANAALAQGLHNVFFIRTEIEYLPEICAPGVAQDIWLLFPDPYPQFGKSRKRLTSPRFLDVYGYLLSPGGRVHLKTDDERLFKFTIETVRHECWSIHTVINDVYPAGYDGVIGLQTSYERRHLAQGRTIRYISFAPHAVD
jgi:tRNA (guanine-N7-)-methyltransferase